MKVRVGTAPDSWGVWFPNDPLQTPWQRYLDEVAAAGYEWTELGPYGYLPTDARTLRGELERRGLRLLGATEIGPLHDPAALPRLREETLQRCELLAAFGARFLVLIPDSYTDLSGALLRPRQPSEADWRQLVAATGALGALVRERYRGSIQLTFHSHADSYVEYAAQLERLLAETDPEDVFVCMDTGHYAYRDGDPIAFMRRHHARTPYLHIKTVDATVLERAQQQGLGFAQAVRLGTFCEPQDGAIDFPAFADALRELDYDGWAAVEQDMYPCDFDAPLPIARRTRAFLESLGLG